MRFLTPGFFPQIVPLGPLIHGLKRFGIKIRIRGEIRFDATTKIDSQLCAIQHSAESTPRCAALRGVLKKIFDLNFKPVPVLGCIARSQP
jgi:hypothetical protein